MSANSAVSDTPSGIPASEPSGSSSSRRNSSHQAYGKSS